NDLRSDQPAVPTAAMPLMSRLSPMLCEFARPLSHAGRGAAAVVGRSSHERRADSSLDSVSAGQTDCGADPDSILCGAASHGGLSAAGAPTSVVCALAAGVEDGFDDEPGVLAGIARMFLSVAIVFAMTMGLWTASRSPIPQAGQNPSAVAGVVAFPGPAAQSSTSSSGRYRTKPIVEIQTGERVWAANPQMDHAVVTASEIEPATWRNIRLRMRKQHGGTLEIVLLRPLAWLAEQVDEFEQLAVADSHASVLPHAVRSRQNHAGVQLDSDVGDDSGWIHLALPELGAVGPAEVLAIGPCPPLASGPGRTVTGTFAHSAADVLDLEIEGLDTPLGCTANHPFWSADRQDFVPAGSLTIGEHLRTESGTRRQVTRITPRRGPPVAVFNLEVDDEHVYYVSTAGVLVHNTYPGNAPNSAATRGLKKAFEHIDTVGDSLTARRRASELSGLGDDSVPFISDVGPQTGWNVGRQSKDGLRGWRMDWDPNKGYHINWWDKTGGAKRKDWLNGAIKIDGGAWHDYIELLKHGFGN
ncbi:MAG: polymorphic toxin-type HINT domain-containing protein, partial [Planctomycetaceae bacterium]